MNRETVAPPTKQERRYKKPKHMVRDIFILCVSIAFGVWIYTTNALTGFDDFFIASSLLGSFIAGMLFTSAFTITPAAAILAKLMENTPIIEVAVMGALGAVIGDLVIFLFVRDSLSNDLNYLFRISRFKRIKEILKLRSLRFVTPIIGALIIALPLPPDEVGLAMMGMSKMKTSVLIPISYVMNALGIILIAAATGQF